MKKDQKVYAKENGINLRRTPDTSDESNIILKLKQDAEVLLVDEPWLKVKVVGEEGWVRMDKVVEVKNTPYDTGTSLFIIGQAHPAEHATTKAVRTLISDVLNGSKNGYALQCTEYVTYCIQTRLGIIIQWPVSSGRHGGKWPEIFKDSKVYKVLSEPEVNCAVSFTEVRRKDGSLTEEGHVAFVEQVLPDGLIKISEVNWPKDGIYSERSILKDKWQNHYKAKFVKFH